MQRLTRIALALSLPMSIAACGDADDNEDDTGVDTGDSDTDPSSSMSATDPTATTMTTSNSASDSDTEADTSDSDPTNATEADTTDTDEPPPGCVSADDEAAPRVDIAATIDADTTLTCDTVWQLTEVTYVNGAVLTLEPGTNVVGQNGSALVIGTDASIEAAGTAAAPIVFTSAQPAGSRSRADWGGLVLLGLGEVNLPNGTGVAEGIANPPMYGGTDTAHNCGTLQYVRVEFAGFQLLVDNELNGITFYACGTGTTVDHVQSHMGSDDAFEAFGGGFDAKYLIATGMADDAFDFDLGFEGTVQYALVRQDPDEADGNHGLEWSNGPDNFTATPLTSPWIANLTFIGQGDGGNAAKSIGFNIKQGAEAHIINSYFTNVTGPAATFQDEPTIIVAETPGRIVVEGALFGTNGGFGHQGDADYSWSDEDWQTFILDQPGNMDGVDLMLGLEWPEGNSQPAADSAAVGAGVDPGNAAFDATTYVGAIDPEGDDWTKASWTNYATE